MTTAQLNELTDRVHQLAKDKGWHSFQETDHEYSVRARNNLHGEVAELWEAHRAGNLNQPCDKAERMDALGIKPLTCAEEELADIVIRVLDTGAREKTGVCVSDHDRFFAEDVAKSIPLLVWHLNSSIDDWCMADVNNRSEDGALGLTVALCEVGAKLLGLDLWSAVERKHQYNATREYRHGGKVA